MKKMNYMTPEMEEIVMNVSNALLAGSVEDGGPADVDKGDYGAEDFD